METKVYVRGRVLRKFETDSTWSNKKTTNDWWFLNFGLISLNYRDISLHQVPPYNLNPLK